MHLVEDLGIRALKLHPPHQLFRPNAYVDGGLPGLRVLYDACSRHGLPVIFHTGTSIFPRARNRFADPLYLDDVAVDFPDLTIVLAHGGRPIWTETAVMLARRFPNVWLETLGNAAGATSRLLPPTPQDRREGPLRLGLARAGRPGYRNEPGSIPGAPDPGRRPTSHPRGESAAGVPSPGALLKYCVRLLLT